MKYTKKNQCSILVSMQVPALEPVPSPYAINFLPKQEFCRDRVISLVDFSPCVFC